MLWFSNNLQKQIKFMNRGSTVYKFQVSLKSFNIYWGSRSPQQWARRLGLVLWEPVQDADHEEYLVLSNLTAPVYTPYIKLRSELREGSKNKVVLLWVRPTLLPKTKPHKFQAYYQAPQFLWTHWEFSLLTATAELPSYRGSAWNTPWQHIKVALSNSPKQWCAALFQYFRSQWGTGLTWMPIRLKSFLEVG